jgi:hypothetical protein
LGGKNKAALYDAGLLDEGDYFKPLNEITQNGIIIPSEKALTHAELGYIREGTKAYPEGRLMYGGHGQSAIDELTRRGMHCNVSRTCVNGVRFGEVHSHDETMKRKNGGQSWFPKEWSRENIRAAGIYVANRGKDVPHKSAIIREARWSNVNVRVMFDLSGNMVSIFPSYDQ